MQTLTNRRPKEDSDKGEFQSLERLYFFDELAEWQQDNHFIRSGYVKETKSYINCLRSLTYWHNESINVYSHLLPSSISLWLISYQIFYILPQYENYLGAWEILNFYQFGFAVTFCLFLSASFHCFKCHSHKVSKLGNQCDYFGIIVLITCSLNSIVLFAFYDAPYLRTFFVCLFVLLGTICTKLTFDVKFSTPAYRPFRSLMFILFGLSGILPVLTAIVKYGLLNARDRASAEWLVGEGFFYIFGACIYAARIPERFVYSDQISEIKNKKQHGAFDIIGHGHQIFHVMVVIAAFCHWNALVGCYTYLHEVTLASHI